MGGEPTMFDPFDPPKDRHYCRLANALKNGKPQFHLDWTKNVAEKYMSIYGSDFYLIFYRNKPPMMYYAIPYQLIEETIPESHLDGSRWHGYIEDNVLKVTKRGHKMATLDVTEFLYVLETKITNNRLPKPFGVGDNEDPLLTEQDDGEGTVYIIVNEFFNDWVKIGCSKNLPLREKNYQTYSPGEYTVYAYIISQECYQFEQKLHNEILRPNPNFSSVREWHNITKEEAIEFIKDAFPQSAVIYPERSTKSLFEY